MKKLTIVIDNETYGVLKFEAYRRGMRGVSTVVTHILDAWITDNNQKSKLVVGRNDDEDEPLDDIEDFI